jgi:hypothetical protein
MKWHRDWDLSGYFGFFLLFYQYSVSRTSSAVIIVARLWAGVCGV